MDYLRAAALMGLGVKDLSERPYAIDAILTCLLKTREDRDYIHDFNYNTGRRAVNSKTTVVIFSGGYDTKKPEYLIPEMQILQRRARRVIWVTPLLGRFEENEADPKIHPIKPYLDVYCSGHKLEVLAELGNIITR